MKEGFFIADFEDGMDAWQGTVDGFKGAKSALCCQLEKSKISIF